MNIGLVPGSFKPYHRGHDDLVKLAAEENDIVYVYYSLSPRGDIGGQAMKIIMDKFIKPSYTGSNVEFLNVAVPVRAVYTTLENANESGSKSVYTIYSDSEDISKYKKSTLEKSAPDLFANEQILLRGVERGVETTDISGTEMREYLAAGDVAALAEMLPTSIRQHADDIIMILRGELQENLLKNYIKDVFNECKRKI